MHITPVTNTRFWSYLCQLRSCWLSWLIKSYLRKCRLPIFLLPGGAVLPVITRTLRSRTFLISFINITTTGFSQLRMERLFKEITIFDHLFSILPQHTFSPCQKTMMESGRAKSITFIFDLAYCKGGANYFFGLLRPSYFKEGRPGGQSSCKTSMTITWNFYIGMKTTYHEALLFMEQFYTSLPPAFLNFFHWNLDCVKLGGSATWC